MDALHEMAPAIEKAGFSSCYVTDHPAPSVEWLESMEGHDALDPMTALAFVAAMTSRLMLQANVMVLPYRNPFILSKSATTLQVLSGNRLIMGVAAGFARAEMEALGADPKRRGDLADEALETLRLIWTGKPVTKRGLNFNAVNILPRPNPTVSPPIWVGGSNDRAVARAAQWGDGWAPFWVQPARGGIYGQTALAGVDDFRSKLARIHELRDEAGRTGPFDVALGPTERLKSRSREDVDAYLESVAAIAELGVTWTTMRFKRKSVREYLEDLQWAAEEVIPRMP